MLVFRDCLEMFATIPAKELETQHPVSSSSESELESIWKGDEQQNKCKFSVSIEQLPADFPQFFDYSRTKYLELWKIEAKRYHVA